MTTPTQPIRAGLIGYGYAGRTFHAPLLRCVPGLVLSVVGSTKPEVVNAAIPEAIVCPPDEVPTREDLDLVVIATPNESHFPLAAATLRAGKHVVLDKPFTVALAEARELVQIAEQHDRLLSVFHNRRWESEVLGTQAALQSGALGQVTHYECHMDRFRPNVRKRWREDPGPGAGLWFDLGPHLIDLALYLFGLPDTVNASFATLRPGGQTEDWAHVQLGYKNSDNSDRLRVILNASLLVSGGGPRSVLHGTRGSWAKYGMDPQEAQLVAGMLPTDPAFGKDSDPGILFDGATGQRTEIPVPAGNQLGYYIGIRDAILSGEPAPIPAATAVAVMAILETTFQSGAEGRTLPVPLTPDERGYWTHWNGSDETNAR